MYQILPTYLGNILSVALKKKQDDLTAPNFFQYKVLVPLGEERRRQRELELLAEGAEQTEAAYVPAPPSDSAEELKY